MADKGLIDTFKFCNDLFSSSLNAKFEEIGSFFNEFIPQFMIIFEEESLKIPYHINIIDELHANENSHSRILVKLLQAKDGVNYYILKSFFEYLGTPFSKLANESVISISSEKDRIDMRIRGRNYSLIIENKIHNAQEQKDQIKRYIEIEKNIYPLQNIYVLNIGRFGNEEPTEFSFPEQIKNDIGENYLPIGFRDTILPWLENNVHQICNLNSKGIFLESAINQYIDHLKGVFNLRENQKAMEKKLENFILEKLNLFSETKNTTSLRENYVKLKEKADEIDKVKIVVDKMTDKAKNDYYFALWSEKIETRFPNKKFVIDRSKESDQKLGIELKFKDISFICLIVVEITTPYFTCRKIANGNKGDYVDSILQELFNSEEMTFPDSKNLDYCYKDCDFEDIYELFEKNVLKIIERIEK